MQWEGESSSEFWHHHDAALSALEAGEPGKALLHYQSLQGLRPSEGDWPRKCADCFRRLGDRDGQLGSLERAAELYSASDELLKAIAMCKMALALDPRSPRASEWLASLEQRRRLGIEAAETVASSSAEESPVGSSGRGVDVALGGGDRELSDAPLSQRPTIPIPARARAALDSGQIMGGAKRKGHGGFDGVHLLEVGDDPPSSRGAQAVAALGRTNLFDALDGVTLRALVEKASLVELEPQQWLLQRGEPANAMFVVVDGGLTVSRHGAPVAHLSEGDFFGEIGLLSNDVRHADVCADGPCCVLSLDKQLVEQEIEREPKLLELLLHAVRERLVGNLMQQSPLFRHLDPQQAVQLASRFQFLDIEHDTRIVVQGQPAQGLYLLLTGHATVVADGATLLGELTPGDIFGELSMLSRSGAMADVVTSRQCYALFLPDREFRETIMTHPVVLEFVSDVADARQVENEGGKLSQGRMTVV